MYADLNHGLVRSSLIAQMARHHPGAAAPVHRAPRQAGGEARRHPVRSRPLHPLPARLRDDARSSAHGVGGEAGHRPPGGVRGHTLHSLPPLQALLRLLVQGEGRAAARFVQVRARGWQMGDPEDSPKSADEHGIWVRLPVHIGWEEASGQGDPQRLAEKPPGGTSERRACYPSGCQGREEGAGEDIPG